MAFSRCQSENLLSPRKYSLNIRVVTSVAYSSIQTNFDRDTVAKHKGINYQSIFVRVSHKYLTVSADFEGYRNQTYTVGGFSNEWKCNLTGIIFVLCTYKAFLVLCMCIYVMPNKCI